MEPEFANPLATCCQQHFFTAEELDRHTAEHVVCPGVPGTEDSSCGCSIHPTAIAFHLETEHATASPATDTKSGAENSDPALKRWREARRRRDWPLFARFRFSFGVSFSNLLFYCDIETIPHLNASKQRFVRWATALTAGRSC